MAELATIARPYAEALFKSTQADMPRTSQWLEALASIVADARLLQYAENPKVSDREVYEMVTGVAREPLPPVGQNFLRTVIENGRLRALPEVAAQYRAMVNAQGGASDAVVYSAFPIPPAGLGEVSQTLERRFGRKLNVTVQEDPSLIGGIRVVVGDEVLDTSVKARLEQMRVALTA
ncbi:MAG: ATP synthase delta chain [uncultured Ramlibacter sp.]|uniref:ATP synthase subunit delta n=1 Tax=uncultured Ramlibacter sp. TaxID=260755 RepID=A0A6J4PSL7_9BURK|nr:MAG: ATP synthase delta chain [uncultured Ramlibacter sp.]